MSRLPVVQHKPAADGTPARLMFVFDSDPMKPGRELILQSEEIAEALWLEVSDAVRQHTDGGRERLAAAFRARREGLTIYMDADRILAF